MIRLAFVAVFAFALGVLIRDVAQDWREPQLKVTPRQSVLTSPIRCDATVEQRTKPTEPWSKKCYVARYQR